jgi:hypothetical protein
MSGLPYHVKVVDHSKNACTCSTSASGLQDALAYFSPAVVSSAHVKMKVALRTSSVSAMDLYTERLLGTPLKSPAVASAAWLFVSYHQ